MTMRVSERESENQASLKLEGVYFYEDLDDQPYASVQYKLAPLRGSGSSADIFIQIDNASPADSQDAIVELAWEELENRLTAWKSIASRRGR